MKGHLKDSVLAPLFKLTEATFELFVPLVVAKIIDVGIKNADTAYIIKCSGLLALLAFAGLAFSATAQFFAARAAVGVSSKLRHSLFEHINSLSYADTDKIGSATLITRMTSDVEQVQAGFNMFLRLFLRSPFVVIGAMVMAYTVDVTSANTFAVTIPALSVVVFGIMLISIPLFKKVQKLLDKILGITRENLSGVRVIRAFRKEDSEYERFRDSNKELYKRQTFVGRISALLNPVTYVIINGAVIFLIYIGAIRVNSGLLSQGQVIALYNYMSQILVELIKLANLIIAITKSVACGKRIESVLDTQPTMEEEKGEIPENIKGEVEFKNVGITYAGAGSESLSDISFKALSGKTVGIIGGTGSGKTTLINLIPRFYDVTRGSVLIDGKDVREYNAKKLREYMGLVPQKAVLFKGTVRSNLLWGNENADDEALWDALKIAQADDFIKAKQGLETLVEQGGRNFSGGQRQRLTIARALVRKPKILILDDSASALDMRTDALLRREISKSSEEMTVFIVAQRAASVMQADLILVLDDGKCVGMGTHDELLKSCSVYNEIYSSQFGKEDEDEI